MANLIKGALIKQISKYLKNVTPNQINISTLKGEGEMKNIQLDENVLMDLIELPTWLKITNAKCNKANVKIPWTKLKTSPIIISLDKIEIDMEITETLRDYSNTKPSQLIPDKESAYNFIDRCIDAMQLNIDSITITIKSDKFNANLNMSNIFVYSVGPDWRPKSDITLTKLKDTEKEEIILFKEISWETCRLEASMQEANSLDANQQQTSIKLIMNPSKIQIALKKRLADKSLISSTFRVLLNEIYWMANDIQLKAAIGTYNMISKLMKKSFEQKRKFVAAMDSSAAKTSAGGGLNALGTKTNVDVSKVFQQYDIKETSLHLHVSVLNVHLYADDNYSSNKLIDGGAMQILFKGLCFDHYPYHRPGLNTLKYWNNHNYTFDQREEWSKMLINDFISKLEDIIDKANITSLNKIKLKPDLNLMESASVLTLNDFCIYKVTTNMSNSLNKTTTTNKMKAAKKPTEELEKQAPQEPASINVDHLHLLRNELLKKKEFFLEQQTYNKRSFLSSNYAEFNLPSDTLFAQLFFSEFYFPSSSSGQDECNYPLPSPQLYAQFSPLLVNIDYLTLLWVNTLMLSIYREKILIDKSIKSQQRIKRQLTSEPDSESPAEMVHCDSYIEFIMPKVNLNIFNSVNDIAADKIGHASAGKNHSHDAEPAQSEHPCAIEIGLARFFLTNQTVTKPPEYMLTPEPHSSSDYNLNLTVNEELKPTTADKRSKQASKSSMAFVNQAKKNFKHLYDSWTMASKASLNLIEKNSLKLAPIPLKASMSKSDSDELSGLSKESLLTRSEVKTGKDGRFKLLNEQYGNRARSAATTPTMKSKTPFRLQRGTGSVSKHLRFKHLAPCFKQILVDENFAYQSSSVLARHYSSTETRKGTEDDLALSSGNGLVLKILDKSSLNKSASKDLWQIELENFWVDLLLPKPAQPPPTPNDLKSRSTSSMSLSTATMPLVKNSSFKFWAANVHDFYHDKKIQLYDKYCAEFESSGSLVDSGCGESNGFRQKIINLSSKIIKIDDHGDQGAGEPFEIRSRIKARSNSITGDYTDERKASVVPLTKYYSKLNVIGYIDRLSVECKHSQINFLLRLIDTVDLFTKQLEIDSKHTLKHGSSVLASVKDAGVKKAEELKQDAALVGSDATAANDDDVSVNLFVRVNQIDVDLIINEIRKEIPTRDFVPKVSSEPLSQADLNGDKTPEAKPVGDDDLNASESGSVSKSTDTGIDCTINTTTSLPGKSKAAPSESAKSSMTDEDLRRDFVLMAYSNDKEFLNQYLLFTYGLSTINPHTTLVTTTAAVSSSSKASKAAHAEANAKSVPAVSFVNKNTSPTSSFVDVASSDKSQKAAPTKPSLPPPPVDRKSSICSTVSNYGDLDLSSATYLNDDGDNYSLLLKEQEDETASQMSFNSFETVNKVGGAAVLASSSIVSSSGQQQGTSKDEGLTLSASLTSLNKPAASGQQNQGTPDSQNLSPSSMSSSETRIVTKTVSETQTQNLVRKINIRLAGLNVYLDSSKDQGIACALINVESLQLENARIKPLAKSKNVQGDNDHLVLIRFRKLIDVDDEESDDIESVEETNKVKKDPGDLVELYLENARLSLNIPTLAALAELIEDDKDTFEFLKKFKGEQAKRSDTLNLSPSKNGSEDWNDQDSVDSDDEESSPQNGEIERETVLPIDITLRNFKLNLHQTDLDKNDGNREIKKKALSLLINKKLKINKLNTKETKIVIDGNEDLEAHSHEHFSSSTTLMNELKMLSTENADPFQMSLPAVVTLESSTSKYFSLTKQGLSQSEMQLFQRPDGLMSSALNNTEYASLIYQLRRSKEENKQMLQKSREREEKLMRRNLEERDKYEALVRQLKTENEMLKQQQAQPLSEP